MSTKQRFLGTTASIHIQRDCHRHPGSIDAVVAALAGVGKKAGHVGGCHIDGTPVDVAANRDSRSCLRKHHRAMTASGHSSMVLSQAGATITVSGNVNGSPINVTATNMTSLFANTGQGSNDSIDASGMTMAVTLNMNGGGGSQETLLGGHGNDVLYASASDFSFVPLISGGTYDGHGGNGNAILLPAVIQGSTETYSPSTNLINYHGGLVGHTEAGFFGPPAVFMNTFSLSNFERFGFATAPTQLYPTSPALTISTDRKSVV